jgi:hypothetical protein
MCLLVTLFNSVNELIVLLHCYMTNLTDLTKNIHKIRLPTGINIA